MSPGLLNLKVQQGDTFGMVLTLSNPLAGSTVPAAGTPIDLTGCQAELQIRKQTYTAILYSLNSAAPTANGGSIVLGGIAGTVTLSIPPLDTVGLPSGVYDLRIKFPNGAIETFVAGAVTVAQQVTQWT